MHDTCLLATVAGRLGGRVGNGPHDEAKRQPTKQRLQEYGSHTLRGKRHRENQQCDAGIRRGLCRDTGVRLLDRDVCKAEGESWKEDILQDLAHGARDASLS